MSDLADYFLASRRDVAGLELLELTHPNFTQPYRIVRNPVDPADPNGVTVTLSGTEPDVRFQYYPAQFRGKGARDDLEYQININLGDLGEILPQEMDAVTEAGGLLIKPRVRYFVFRSDDLTAPILGPVNLEAPTINFDGTVSSIDARAPALNTTKTGERYTVERFPMLRGFLR
jgi:hypothetical protein